jgi:predicted O-methyltransferase YrrM
MSGPTNETASNDVKKSEFIFTNNWFDRVKKIWEQLIPQIKPTKILEIGSYEGASACYLIKKLAKDTNVEIHCIDTWEGGIEHKKGGQWETDMNSVESRFNHNTRLAIDTSPNKVDLVVHKGFSDLCLSRLISDNKKNYFDFIYIDGSHEAPDVLCDAVLAFRLLKIGGIMAFDDYLWAENLPYGKDPLRCPKPAIDAFINLNFRKLNILSAPLLQLYIKKLSD